MYVFIVCVHMGTLCGGQGTGRIGNSSFLPPCGCDKLNSGHQDWQKVSLPSCWSGKVMMSLTFAEKCG